MDRIGIAASKIAKGNIFLYNACVFFLVFLFAFFIFLIAGAAVMMALVVVGYMIKGLLPQGVLKEWNHVVVISMASLTAVVAVFSAAAVIKNFKLKLSGGAEEHGHER